MKLMELIDRFGHKILINFDRVEHIQEVHEADKTFTRLQFTDGCLYVQETYAQLKKAWLAGE